MSITITKKVAKATETKQLKNKNEIILDDTKEENIEIPDFVKSEQNGSVGDAGPWCEVGLEASFTKNLGNFQSQRVGVSLKVPCLIGEIDEVFKFTEGWVDEKMEALTADE